MKKSNDTTHDGVSASAADALGELKETRINRSPRPVVSSYIRNLLKLRRLEDKEARFPEDAPLNARVFIVEGISGSGKDTFQDYLKDQLKGRAVYDYSEGELLHSWKHLQIDGIFGLRVAYMKCFVKYVKRTIVRDKNAVFILNRFHLSTYVSTIVRHPELRKGYDETVDVLRTLPVHVFILQLNENEIEERSLHPERSTAWDNHRQQMINKEGFRGTLERYIWQQKLVFETAKQQQIPYSVIKLPFTSTNWKDIRIETIPQKKKPPAILSKALISDKEIRKLIP
jgi:thymidylate kinase